LLSRDLEMNLSAVSTQLLVDLFNTPHSNGVVVPTACSRLDRALLALAQQQPSSSSSSSSSSPATSASLQRLIDATLHSLDAIAALFDKVPRHPTTLRFCVRTV
jgi:hypothetical protein